jgi:hypothetical protein
MSRLNYLILIIIFSSCSKQSIIENKFIGTWTSVDKITPYKAILTISSDSTFNFSYGACQARGFSEGAWKLLDSLIVLNSYKTDSCYFVSGFGMHCYEITDTSHWGKKTHKDCDATFDMFYTIFDDDQFEIRNDSLYHIEELNNNCPDIKGMEDIFTRKKN